MTMKNKLKNPRKADLDKDGKLSGYEKKRGMAVEKAMGAKKGKMFRNGGNVLVPFIDYKRIAGMGRTKPKKKKEEIREKNEKVSAIVPKQKPYTSEEITSEPKSFGVPPVASNPRYMDSHARESYESEKQQKPKKSTTKRKQSGAPTFPATMTVAGATSSAMKRKGTEGKRAKSARMKQQNITDMKNYLAGRNQRIYEDKIATANFFGSIFGSNAKRKSLPDILTGKKQGGLGVKLAKGGFKKKTPIY